MSDKKDHMSDKKDKSASRKSGGKNKLSCEEAKERYGVYCDFGIMPTNSEARFRLISERDGTAYIRTMTDKDASGWQNSHYHKGLRETYIVQKEWICYAELRNQNYNYIMYVEGEIFTTEPEVVHNIYMPSEAVIHTVKHGKPVPNPARNGNDWWGKEGKVEVGILNGQTTSLLKNVNDILKLAQRKERLAEKTNSASSVPSTPINSRYNEAYRHFDQLIWAIPTAAGVLLFALIAVFAGVLSGYQTVWKNGILLELQSESTESFLVPMSGVSASGLLTVFLVSLTASVFLVSHTVHRFRWHQATTKWFRPRPRFATWNPQVGLQFFVNVAGCVSLWLTLSAGLTQVNFQGYSPTGWGWFTVAILLAAIVSYFQDLRVRAKHKATWEIIEGTDKPKSEERAYAPTLGEGSS